MQFSNTNIQRGSEDFKEKSIQLMEHHHIADKELSALFGVSAMTIHRWKSSFDECNLPAFILRFLNFKEQKYIDFAISIIRYLAEEYNYNLVQCFKSGRLNGTLHDEIIESIRELGEISKCETINAAEALSLRYHAEKLIQAGYTMLAEIKAKVK